MTPDEKKQLNNVIGAIVGVAVVLIVGWIVITTQQHQMVIYCSNSSINCSNITALAKVLK